MSDASDSVSQEKVQAYFSARYRIFLPDGVLTLQIGEREPRLASLLAGRGEGAAFITAYNPFGEIRDETENLRHHSRLAARLRAVAEASIRGEGVDPANVWPPEPSILAIGLQKSAAMTIGREFGQDAIVWIERDVPELLLLRRVEAAR